MDSVEPSPQQDTPDVQPSAPSRWYQRVLPVTGLVLLVLALTAVVVPSFRDQLELSVSRRSQSYVELYFARQVGPVAQAVCTRRGSTATVRFVIASHLATSQPVAWRTSVDPAAKGSRTQRKAGSAATVPGQAAQVRRTFTVPRRTAYTVTVVLPAQKQQLRARCAGGRS